MKKYWPKNNVKEFMRNIKTKKFISLFLKESNKIFYLNTLITILLSYK